MLMFWGRYIRSLTINTMLMTFFRLKVIPLRLYGFMRWELSDRVYNCIEINADARKFPSNTHLKLSKKGINKTSTISLNTEFLQLLLFWNKHNSKYTLDKISYKT